MRKSVRKTSISFKNAKVSPGPSRNTSVHSNVNVSGKRNRTRSILSSQSSNSIRRPSIFRRQTTQQQQNWNFNPNRVVSVTSLNNIAGDNSRKLAARRVTTGQKGGTKCAAFELFWHDFATILFSPLFLRHRNIFYVLTEILLPALVALLIFSAFTSGVAWKSAQHWKHESNVRTIRFPENSMTEAKDHFRTVHVDKGERVLIYFTPVDDFTTSIMQYTLNILGLQDTNIVFKKGESPTGVVGMASVEDMKKHALLHRNERFAHGQPVGVTFEYDPKEVSKLTGVPFNLSYTISNFDQSISKTSERFPFIPPAMSDSWRSPYLKSGFLGLQHAIEESLIHIIIDKQKTAQIRMVDEEAAAEARNMDRANGSSEHKMLEKWEIDENILFFMIEQTLEEIRKEKQRREEELKHSNYDYDVTLNKRVINSNGPLGRASFQEDTNDKAPEHKIRSLSTLTELPHRSLKAFNFDRYGTVEYRHLILYVVTFSLVVAYSFMTFLTVHPISTENASGMTELLTIHGLRKRVRWSILCFHAFVFRAITSALVLMAMRVDYGHGRVIDVSQPDVLYMLLYIHQLTLTFMNYFIATYIKNVKLCGLIAMASCILSFYLPETFSDMKLVGALSDIILTLIFPNWLFRHAMDCLMDHEANDKGIGWDNIMEIEFEENTISVGEGMIRLVAMGVCYLWLAVYFESDTARFSNHPKKCLDYLCFCKKRNESQQLDDEDISDMGFTKPPVYQEPPPDKQCLVKIRNLSKNYGKHKQALDSLSIDIMHEEITVILGHSGCGKSTLISILAGVLAPSNGKATVRGYDVTTQTDKARQYLGVCPQRMLSLNLLTVREHVHLCYKLKGYAYMDCNKYTASMLTQLKLWNVRTCRPGNLTKDELRRLGLAMSMVDVPDILLLDEPTRGMDAMARRELWDIILSMRHHHTIILTTNYMDEAEHLADTLALIAHGRLVCCGSLNFLKSQYDTGYFLKLVPVGENVDSNAVVKFAKGILGPKVQIKRHKRLKDVDTLELELPSNEMNHFADFCAELDKKMDDLSIKKYSIRQVTLNDIFIKICSSVASGGYAVDLYVRKDSAGDIKTVLNSEIPEIPGDTTKNTGRVHQFKTLVNRSFTIWKTSKRRVIMHFMIPLIIIWIVVFQAKLFVQLEEDSPELDLQHTKFDNIRIFSQVNHDDPNLNFRNHLSRVLDPAEEIVDSKDRIIPKLYAALGNAGSKAGYVKTQRIIAFELGMDENMGDYQFVGYFATGALHSAPLALNIMNNVILRALSDGERNFTSNWHPYSVNVRNHPMPQVNAKGVFENGCGLTCVLLALLMSCALAFISHACVVLPQAEAENGIKHQILMCNVEPTNYWLSMFLIDVAFMFVISVVIVLIFLSDLNRTFRSAEVMGAVWFICTLYLMWSGLLYGYYIVSITPTRISCFDLLGVLHFVFGIVLLLWLTISRPVSGILIFFKNLLLFLLPPYTMTSALYHFFINSGQRNVCRNINFFVKSICEQDVHKGIQLYSGHTDDELRSLDVQLSTLDPALVRCCERRCRPSPSHDTCFHPPRLFNVSAESWENTGLITDVSALFFQGFLYWALLIMSERRVFSRWFQQIVLKFLHGGRREDDEYDRSMRKMTHIRHESVAVREVLGEDNWPDDVALVCHNLTKSSTSTMIIKNFNLEVKKGQCVAILGRGNSGKSCIARMISGDLLPTTGNIFMDGGMNLIQNRKQYLSHIGYCPQKSNFYQGFTGSQMLDFMGRMRGVPSNVLSTHVNKWLSVMGLADAANDVCGDYGDGLRQRLCVAMALIGQPEIILLDEPTTGVDPSTRERIWCVIEHLKFSSTIILTTYSTEEAFSLADKVVIVADGGIQCVGHPDEIQESYAQGHTITFRLRHDVMSSAELMAVTEARVVEFKEDVESVYKYVDMLDEHDEMLMFFVRDTRLPWAEVFRRGHYLATEHEDIIAGYEVTEGGVDDIFVFLTNKYFQLGKPMPHLTPSNPRTNRKIKEGGEVEELRRRQEMHKRSQTLV